MGASARALARADAGGRQHEGCRGSFPGHSRRDDLRLPGNGARAHTWSKVPPTRGPSPLIPMPTGLPALTMSRDSQGGWPCRQRPSRCSTTSMALTASEALNYHIWDTQFPAVTYLNGLFIFAAGVAILRKEHRWIRR